MEIDKKDPPRGFEVKGVTLNHVANIRPNPNEIYTFISPKGAEFDVTAKDWGYYATPSTNGRLKRMGYRTALAHSEATGMRFVLIVDPEKLEEFERYCAEQETVIDAWLDEDL